MTARSRRYSFPGREHRTHVRFTADEFADLAAAAERAGLTPTGYVGEAALAAARGAAGDGETASSRATLAQLQRDLFAARTAVNQATAGLRETPAGRALDEAIAACSRAVAELDDVAGRIHRQLRQAAGPVDVPQP